MVSEFKYGSGISDASVTCGHLTSKTERNCAYTTQTKEASLRAMSGRIFERHNLIPSMSCRDNYYENVVAETFFLVLKRERIKKKICLTREKACTDIFEYIEMFYNSKRKHSDAENMSLLVYEKQETTTKQWSTEGWSIQDGFI